MWRSSAHDATKFGRLARRSVYMSWTKNSSSTVVIAYYNGACQAGVFYGQTVDWLCHLASLWGSFYSWLNAHPVFCFTALIIITFGSVKFWNIFRFLIIIIIPGYKGGYRTQNSSQNKRRVSNGDRELHIRTLLYIFAEVQISSPCLVDCTCVVH